MANPTLIRWTQEKLNTDGSVFDESQFAGFEIMVDGAGAVSIPNTWSEGGTYAFPLSALSLPYGDHSVALRTVAKNGLVSAPSIPGTFTLKDERVPKAPLGVSAA